MPVETFTNNLSSSANMSLIVKSFLLLFLVFFAIFAIILFRQIQLMGRTLPTPLFPFLKFLAILLIGIALALLFVVAGVF